jgi:membrane protein implicated in regulation of membrane protease activity
MNLIEVLSAGAIIALVIGVIGGLLKWPYWVSLLVSMMLFAVFYTFLLVADRRSRSQRKRDQE